MVKRARRDWENFNSDPDTGNYYEFLSLWYRFRTWEGWYNLKRAVKHRNLLELRWYRLRWYRRNANKNVYCNVCNSYHPKMHLRFNEQVFVHRAMNKPPFGFANRT